MKKLTVALRASEKPLLSDFANRLNEYLDFREFFGRFEIGADSCADAGGECGVVLD